jgi:glycosyltransferase involved in cell wall biosynthesis
VRHLRVGIVTDYYPTLQHFDEGTFVKDLSDALVRSGCNVNVIHHRRNYVALFLETLAKRNHFDILDAQFIAPSGILASLMPKRSPLVISVHGGKKNFPNWSTAHQWTHFALNRADAIVVASRFLAAEAERLTNDRKKIHVIPNAVDTSRFVPATRPDNIRAHLGAANDMLLVFSVGRLTETKGFDYLLGAFSKVVSDGFDAVLAIVGGGHQRPYLQSLARTLGVGDRVRFLGRVEHDSPELVRLYSACDIFALTSLVEGHSVAITEAMACGKPIVCSDLLGNREIIINGCNGIMVQPRDTNGIAAAIKLLCGSSSLRAEYGKNSRMLAVERYSWKHRIQRVLEVYTSVLGL